MIKLQTSVEIGESKTGISLKDRILVCGSCFADNIGSKMREAGFNICQNPFGTLYNPVSICNSFARLRSASPFGEDETVQMGSGSELFCSFSHHTSFARADRSDFLENANLKLTEAADFYKQCNKVIITLGTSWCFKHLPDGEIVSNCLKRNANEFERVFLESDLTFGLLRRLVETGISDKVCPKKFIFTVSPIRHMKDGAHGNQISKASLLLAVEKLCRIYPGECEYFPAYEIVLDELRDYRFYAEDMVHPSELAVKSFGSVSATSPYLNQKDRNSRRTNAHSASPGTFRKDKRHTTVPIQISNISFASTCAIGLMPEYLIQIVYPDLQTAEGTF